LDQTPTELAPVVGPSVEDSTAGEDGGQALPRRTGLAAQPLTPESLSMDGEKTET